MENFKMEDKNFFDNYKKIGKCIAALAAIMDSKKTYPLSGAARLHIYRHDIIRIDTLERFTHFSFEDATDCVAQSVDDISSMILDLCKMQMDYISDDREGIIARGDNTDIDGWQVELVSSVFDGKRYPVYYTIFFIDIEHPDKEREYKLFPDEIIEILQDIKSSTSIGD